MEPLVLETGATDCITMHVLNKTSQSKCIGLMTYLRKGKGARVNQAYLLGLYFSLPAPDPLRGSYHQLNLLPLWY